MSPARILSNKSYKFSKVFICLLSAVEAEAAVSYDLISERCKHIDKQKRIPEIRQTADVYIRRPYSIKSSATFSRDLTHQPAAALMTSLHST